MLLPRLLVFGGKVNNNHSFVRKSSSLVAPILVRYCGGTTKSITNVTATIPKNNPIPQQQSCRFFHATSITSQHDTIIKNETIIDSTERNERLRRCLFSVPGHVPKMIRKAQTVSVDSVVLDLEDGVPFDQKDTARKLIVSTLQDDTISFGRSEICIRMNALNTPYALQDLNQLVICPTLQTIVIPKVESEHDIYFVRRYIDSINPSNTIRLLAAIESARGILNLRDIAQCATSSGGTGLDGLIFASEDYCADIEAIRTTAATELLFARSSLVTTAKAYNIQAIDMVHINYRNLSELTIECQQGREIGFTGKQAIHPNQIDIIQQTFRPSEQQIIFATKCIQQYNGTPIVIDGIVVDTPVYKWAQKILFRATAAGMTIPKDPTTTETL